MGRHPAPDRIFPVARARGKSFVRSRSFLDARRGRPTVATVLHFLQHSCARTTSVSHYYASAGLHRGGQQCFQRSEVGAPPSVLIGHELPSVGQKRAAGFPNRAPTRGHNDNLSRRPAPGKWWPQMKRTLAGIYAAGNEAPAGGKNLHGPCERARRAVAAHHSGGRHPFRRAPFHLLPWWPILLQNIQCLVSVADIDWPASVWAAGLRVGGRGHSCTCGATWPKQQQQQRRRLRRHAFDGSTFSDGALFCCWRSSQASLSMFSLH